MGRGQGKRQNPEYMFSIILQCAFLRFLSITPARNNLFPKLPLPYSYCSTELRILKTLLYDYLYSCLVKHWALSMNRSNIWTGLSLPCTVDIQRVFVDWVNTCLYVCIHAFLIPLHFISVDDVSNKGMQLWLKNYYQYLFYIAYKRWVFSLWTVAIWGDWNFVF